MPSATPYRLQADQLVLNKFRVLRALNRGQFGEVYHVMNTLMGRPAALKLIEVTDPASHCAVVEAQAQYLCAHDHVVKIHGADVIEPFVLIEMEYMEGGSVSDLLMREFMPLKDGVKAVKEILFALEHAHSRGLIHRDVKPANIMLATNGAKLSDFGTIIQPDTGVRVTDLFYQPHAAPEAVSCGEFSASSDVFAAGLTLLRIGNNIADWSPMLSSGRAWRDDVRDGTLVQRIGFADFLPRTVKTILRRACERDVGRRYPSAAAFRQALERLRFSRCWKRSSDDEWVNENAGIIEAVRYVAGRQPGVEFMRGTRRRREYCRSFETERDARRFLDQVIAITTIEGTTSSPHR